MIHAGDDSELDEAMIGVEHAGYLNGHADLDSDGVDLLLASPSDVHNADVFARREGHRLRYCGPDKRWFFYDGTRWTLDRRGIAMGCAKAFARALLLYSTTLANDRGRKLGQYALKISLLPRLAAMLTLAQTELPVTPEEFDTNRFALNVANGTLDVVTATLRPHDPADLITKIAPTEYDPAATCPTWLRFLDEVLCGRAELVAYVQLLAGYMLTGDTREHVLPILYGLGANGKSVFMETLQTLLGDYATRVDASIFLARREQGGGANPEIARLAGARLVTASELPEGGRLSENLVKALTGGDRMVARHLYADPFEFAPTFKILLATNHKPKVKGDDFGIWRRLKLLPFDARFEGDSRDPLLKDKLAAELPGILAWAVTGCQRWLAEGLHDPAAVTDATGAYRADSDSLGAFLEEECIITEGIRTPGPALYGRYHQWSEANNERPVPNRTFFAKLRERGFPSPPPKSNGAWIFRGIGLRDRTSDHEPDDGPDRDEALERDEQERFAGTSPSSFSREDLGQNRPFVPVCPSTSLVADEWTADDGYLCGTQGCQSIGSVRKRDGLCLSCASIPQGPPSP